ncbi:hypothetical protein NECAME_07161 [Necator americanus]|uniref:Uncharacterized protein n=1 Tax=Necator americanus TaxID=51031 RepID=W2TQC5_NECAM|nr:hypothetical protein NECAME_07161 [Necator americanus]ETN83869.1 hypothetical protein NECAME_07161 [Necator americanus]
MNGWRTMTSMRQTSVPINVYERPTDIEAGRGPPYVHPPATSNVASCEGSSSRVTPPSSQPPMMAPSPHSRFIDGFRRRTRLRSCNVPATGQESLDMDLGFPPVCSPPPDVGPVSTPDTFGGPRLRRRTVSDAAHTGINFVLNKLDSDSLFDEKVESLGKPMTIKKKLMPDFDANHTRDAIYC